MDGRRSVRPGVPARRLQADFEMPRFAVQALRKLLPDQDVSGRQIFFIEVIPRTVFNPDNVIVFKEVSPELVK